jgi:hypothetical protein
MNQIATSKVLFGSFIASSDIVPTTSKVLFGSFIFPVAARCS